MNWEAIGAVGEVGGAIAVVATLVYLARQIQSGTRAAAAATTWDASRLLAEYHGRMNQRPELASILFRGYAGPDGLDDQERMQFLAMTAEIFHIMEGLYRQWRLGFLSDEAWRPIERGLRRQLQTSLIDEWWASEMAVLSDEFRHYVDSIRDASDESDWKARDVSREPRS